MSTELEKLLIKFPDKPWNWSLVSKNPNITIEFIDEYSDLPWDWQTVSSNPNLNITFFKKYHKKLCCSSF